MAAMKMLAGNCKKSSVEMFRGTSQHSGDNPWKELNPTYTPFILGIFGSAFFTLRVSINIATCKNYPHYKESVDLDVAL